MGYIIYFLYVSLSKVHQALGLDALKNRTFQIFKASAIRGDGLDESMEWLSNSLQVILCFLWLQWDKKHNICRIYKKFHCNMFNLSILGTEIKFEFQRMPFHDSYYAKYIFLSNLSIYWIIYCYCITHSLKFTMQQWTMKHQNMILLKKHFQYSAQFSN